MAKIKVCNLKKKIKCVRHTQPHSWRAQYALQCTCPYVALSMHHSVLAPTLRSDALQYLPLRWAQYASVYLPLPCAQYASVYLLRTLRSVCITAYLLRTLRVVLYPVKAAPLPRACCVLRTTPKTGIPGHRYGTCLRHVRGVDFRVGLRVGFCVCTVHATCARRKINK